MVVRIVIAGQTQCEIFAEMCLIADHFTEKLPNFYYEKIEKAILEYEQWLCGLNLKNKWHHIGSPLIWKESLMKGSKPYYIGGASEFLDYCHLYYQFDLFSASEKFQGLVKNFSQFERKCKIDKEIEDKRKDNTIYLDQEPASPATNFTVLISCAGFPIAMHLISGLLDMSVEDKTISKIYIYDSKCSKSFMDLVEQECSYIGSIHPRKVVKVVEKVGHALACTDLFIILDHVLFNPDLSIGDWLDANMQLMQELAFVINTSASRKMSIIFPNLGPACYNATILMKLVPSINRKQIVVATSDLGFDVSAIAAEIAEIPVRNMFCPPVWGFVGINHLVDIRTTFHKYNVFEPYTRYTKVKNSSLTIGSVTPEMRTMEYLMLFDETLWIKVAKQKKDTAEGPLYLNKAFAVLNVVKLWLFDENSDHVINLGIKCDGSFGLNFQGVFSQPVRLIDGVWKPAFDFLLPKDSQMKLLYLEKIADYVMVLKKGDLPKVISFYPCNDTANKIFSENYN